MQVWKGNIDDCLIAPNRALYYTQKNRIGMAQPGQPTDRLTLSERVRPGSEALFTIALPAKHGPLDFARVNDAGTDLDLVGYPGSSRWAGFHHDDVAPADGVVLKGMYPLGGSAWLCSSRSGISILTLDNDQSFPLFIRPYELDYSESLVTPYVFDDDWLLVALPSFAPHHRPELFAVDRRDLRRLCQVHPFGTPSSPIEIERWTRDWLIVRDVMGGSTRAAVGPSGRVVKFSPPPKATVFTFTQAGDPVYAPADSRGLFVGDRHYDFDLRGPTRGAAVSSDGLTAAYWTGRHVVQFDLE